MSAVLLIFALVACGEPAQPAPPSSTPTQPTALMHLSVDVSTLAAVREGVTIVDVRTRADFDAAHVPGSVVVPLASLDPRDEPASSWDRSVPVYVVDARGEHATEAARLLGAAGFEAFAVDGGMEAWAGAGLPVEPAAVPR